MRKISAGKLKLFKSEIGVLRDEQVISDGTYSEINEYYNQNTTSSVHWILIAFAVLGALSIAGGVILILAHNWDIFGRPARTVLSILPILIGAVWSFFALNKDSVAWKESAGIFYSISVGASIALIGQTYHLPSDTLAFFMTWLLLILPIMFILNSTGSYMVYLALLCTWCCMSMDKTGSSYGFWLLLIPVLARVVYLYKSQKYSPTTIVSWYGIVALLLVCLGVTLEKTIPGLWIIAYSFLLSFAGLLGSKLYKDSEGVSNPLRLVGALGIIVLSYLFTFEWFWHEVGYSYRRFGANYADWTIWYDVAINFAVIVGWAVTIVANFKKHSWFDFLTLALFPIFVTLLYIANDDFVSTLAFNVVLAFFGVAYVVFGAREQKLSQLNWGMIILSVLLFTRFMDDDFSFLARGLVFIVLGSCFLTANIVMVKFKKSSQLKN